MVARRDLNLFLTYTVDRTGGEDRYLLERRRLS